MHTRRHFLHSATAGLGGLASNVALGHISAPGQVVVVPRPRFIEVRSGNGIELRPDVPVLLGESLFGTEHHWMVRPLLRKIQEKGALEPSVVSETNSKLPSPCILIGSPSDHTSLKVLAGRLKPKLGLQTANRLGEGYLLSGGPGGIRIVADTPGGAFYGVQTALQTFRSGRVMRALDVADAPASPFRGIHFPFPIGDPEDMPTIGRFVREVLPRYKANTLIAMINYRFRFRSHPEINEPTMLDESAARQLAAVCRDHNVRLIPLMNCFGHQGGSIGRMRLHGFLRAYPQFNETPCKENALFYNWCPSDPRIPPIAFSLVDELLNAFESDAIHLGMDEVLELGRCQFCRHKTPGELFAKVVNEFQEHVVGKRKVQMMIWADRLIDGRKTPYNPMNGSRNGTHPALHMIPKDIFLCDWHYHLHDTYPSVEMFSEAAFDFVACGWQKKDAIQAFQSYARKNGGERYRGYLATNWGPFRRIADHLLGKASGGETPAGVRNTAECFQLGMELAWTGT